MAKRPTFSKKKLKIAVSKSLGSVTGELIAPKKFSDIIVLAHGAGAGMHHSFMVGLSSDLAERGIATLRFNFPFTEFGKGRPDPPAIAEKTIETALAKANKLFPRARIIAAGKSFGGRMSSHFLSKNFPEYVQGIIFYGFPLHAPGKDSVERADHLKNVKVPMLFLQGTRDALAKLELIAHVSSKLKLATLIKYEGADHSFKSGKKELIGELAGDSATWLENL
jgi:predicted alpha/beta-hydrolase family hydrolase